MKCPHCLESFFETWETRNLGKDSDGDWWLNFCTCPSCNKFICYLDATVPVKTQSKIKTVEKRYLVRPKAMARAQIPKEVPDKYGNDYKEACIVLPDSPKASASLSRRCLQNLLREVTKIKPSHLSDEIQQVIDSENLPSYLSKSIDAIRNIGNFAAHPTKSEKAREIINVEPGEAEWSLDVIEGLFDFYFVQPAKFKAKKENLNKKLMDAGKPEMK